MNRKFLLLANWKMNKSPKEATEYLTVFQSLLSEDVDRKKFIFFPQALSAHVFSKNWHWGGQNCFHALKGSFTGENSPLVLKQMGAGYCLLGHSERRSLFKEDNTLLAKKVKALLECDLKPVLCIGENKKTKNPDFDLTDQLVPLKPFMEKEKTKTTLPDPIVAYEPLWAIGTGAIPLPSDIQKVGEQVKRHFSDPGHRKVQFLYGGSVNPENAKHLFDKCPVLDGFLVGGASLDPHTFYDIYKAIK